MFRSALLILSGNAATSLLLLARNLVVARLIPVADYGVAATFAVAMALVEMMSALGLQQQIVQAKNGEDPRFQAALQGFQLLRGVIAGAVLFAIAGPMAGFLGIPQAAWAYQLLALVPVLNACVHFDIHRLNRQMRFGPLMLTGAVPAVLSLVAVWPLAHWFGDWQVMLYAILLQAIIRAATSHLVAERRWRLVFDRSIMTGSLRFGWPLLTNGILLFLVLNGEKLIVGRELGMTPLAIFAMGVTLTLTPTLVMARSTANFFLPQLSRLDPASTEGKRRLSALASATLQASLVNGALMVLATAVIGTSLVGFLLGPRYDDLLPLLVPLAVLHGLRVFKAGGAVVALSQGESGNAMYANLPRVVALPLGWGLLVSGGTLLHLIWLAIFAEACGFLLSLLLMYLRCGIGIGRVWPALLTVGTLLAASLQIAAEGAGVLILALLFAFLLIVAKDLRQAIIGRPSSI